MKSHTPLGKGPFKYYAIKEVGGWGQKMAILDDLEYCKSSNSWVGGPKKVKNIEWFHSKQTHGFIYFKPHNRYYFNEQQLSEAGTHLYG